MQISSLELYELVSKSPLSKVAPSLGISATTLAEICRKHNVPYPGSGYWTRKSLGQTVMLDPLPLDSEEQPIDIEPAKPRVLRAEGRETDAIIETAKSTEQTAPAIVVPIVNERPIKLHPLIAKWIADRERRRREATASRDPWRIKMAPGLSDIPPIITTATPTIRPIHRLGDIRGTTVTAGGDARHRQRAAPFEPSLANMYLRDFRSRDTGHGLRPESLPRLFEPFYTTKPDGMGMGLSICRSIIEAHGGRLWATRCERRGALFQFTIPAD